MKDYSDVCFTSSISFYHDGTPVPDVLTESEAINFLRLDTDGPKNPEQTLRYYRQEGILKATKVGKRVRYLRSELLKFLDQLTLRTNEGIS